LHVIGVHREIGLIQRHGGAMEKDLAPDSTQSAPDRAIDLNWIRP